LCCYKTNRVDLLHDCRYIALQWMIDHASEHGLRLNARAVNGLKKDPL